SQSDEVIKNRYEPSSPVPVGFRLFVSRIASSLRRLIAFLTTVNPKNRNKCSDFSPISCYTGIMDACFFLTTANCQLTTDNPLRRHKPPRRRRTKKRAEALSMSIAQSELLV